ncbi:hypothetical protein [Halobacterium sp. CBA1126]|uniref:hypothetical protein n=1 Tax=Halobacterium sp. CBA1126 TaxID=2668074 RepID=UPI0012FC3CFE|nr:hypothetical protein [Halobacterium sp. CBA1126]MUV59788.1 hypothetical protein [Halobacterium sp. CBA1126]
MGRLVDLVMLLIAILMFLVLQFIGGAMLDPIRDAILAEGVASSYGAAESFGGMIAVVTKWAPLTGLFGTILLVAYREFRRQRITASTGVRR